WTAGREKALRKRGFFIFSCCPHRGGRPVAGMGGHAPRAARWEYPVATAHVFSCFSAFGGRENRGKQIRAVKQKRRFLASGHAKKWDAARKTGQNPGKSGQSARVLPSMAPAPGVVRQGDGKWTRDPAGGDSSPAWPSYSWRWAPCSRPR